MSHLFHFAQQGLLPNQTPNLAFGDNDVNRFRVTSSFPITNNNVAAYAMMPGTILLQQQAGNPDRVNLILEPIPSSNIKMPVKYVVYRGLDICSFLTRDDVVLTENNISTYDIGVLTEGSELIDRMQAIQRGRLGVEDEDAIVPIPIPALFGHIFDFDPQNIPDIDTFFFHQQANAATQLFLVPGGMELGNFAANSEGGIEIILENPDLTFNVEIARRDFWQIDVTEITNEPTARWMREQIRHFVDPAAFYGLHHDIRGGIGYRNNNVAQPPARGAAAVFEHILLIFHTRNNIYLDIRNENGYSYNYYNEYIDDDGNIRINNNSRHYETNNWPVYILNNNQDLVSNTILNISLLRLADDNPIIIARYIERIGRIRPRNGYFFVDNLNVVDNNFTRTIGITIPHINQLNEHIAGIVRIDYIREANVASNNANFRAANDTDFLFGPIDTKIPWQTLFPVKWMNSHIDRYSNSEDEKILWESGMIRETIRFQNTEDTEDTENDVNGFLYYASPKATFKSRVSRIFNPRGFSFSGGASSSSTFFQGFSRPRSRLEEKTFTYTNPTTGREELNYAIRYVDNIWDRIRRDDEVCFLGITDEQRNRLIAAANHDTLGLSNFHHKFFKLEEIEDESLERQGIVAYGLQLAGFSVANNNYTTVSPNDTIRVFSADGRIFCSAEYAALVLSTNPFNNRIPEVYFERPDDYFDSRRPERNRNHFGFDYLRPEYIDRIRRRGPFLEQANVDINGNLADPPLTGDDAIPILRQEYTPFELNEKLYYVPWLTMYPNHQNAIDYIGEPGDDRRFVKLKLRVENARQVERIFFHLPPNVRVEFEDRIDSEENGNIVIIRNPRDLNRGGGRNHITILCTADLETDSFIRVFSSHPNAFDENNNPTNPNAQLIGKLNIAANNEVINPISEVFELVFSGSLTRGRTFNFNNIATQTAEWRNWLAREENQTKSYLHQCLINYNPDYVKNNNAITAITRIRIDFDENRLYLTRINDTEETPIDTVDAIAALTLFVNGIESLQYNANNNPVMIFRSTVVEIDGVFTSYSMVHYFRHIINACVGEDRRNVRILTCPLICIRTTDNSANPPFGIYQSGTILLIVNRRAPRQLLAHEIGHFFGMEHTFYEDNRRNNILEKRFIFTRHQTDNVMDSPVTTRNEDDNTLTTSGPKVSFWKWQKDIALSEWIELNNPNPNP